MKNKLFLVIAAALVCSTITLAQTKAPVKKNGRPGDTSSVVTPPASASTEIGSQKIQYRYEFNQPNYLIKKILIEHDAAGKGKITFEKKDAEEPIIDPIQLTAVSMEKLNKLFETLNFLDSSEDYQSALRHYGHLGDNQITLIKDEKTRTAKYNWSENLTARELAQEYRKIGEQAVWLFDLETARQMRPLDTPSLMDRLDSLLKRNEISDPQQLLPILKQISNDERYPLIARNHAARMITGIEKK